MTEETGFGLGKQIQDIQFSQATRDQIKQLGIMMEGRRIELEVRGTGKLIEANNQLIAYKQSLVGVAEDTGTTMQGIVNQTQADLEAATGKFRTTFDGEVQASVDSLLAKYQAAFDSLTGGGSGEFTTNDQAGTGDGNGNVGPGANSKGLGGGGKSGGSFARGTVFNTRGTTDITVGEAGMEHVAVLRNPRRLMGHMGSVGGGGGSTTVNVNISGSWNASDKADVDSLADTVARRVEDRLNRRAAVFATVES